MDFQEVVRLLEDIKRQEARRDVERLLNNPSSCQPPWGKNLKELVKWVTEYVVQENQPCKDKSHKAHDKPESEKKSQSEASTSQHDCRERSKVQSEQEPESKAPERPSFKMFQPPHLQDFWSRNPKWVADYFVNAQKYPRLEVIVRAMMQEHLVAEQNFMSTVKAHVNPESDSGKATDLEEQNGKEDRATKTEGGVAGGKADEKTGEGAGEGADDKTEEKTEEKAENKSNRKTRGRRRSLRRRQEDLIPRSSECRQTAYPPQGNPRLLLGHVARGRSHPRRQPHALHGTPPILNRPVRAY